jgi:tRNA pseudouridine32 synthase/23S rRNA pseudouridine746 synthase
VKRLTVNKQEFSLGNFSIFKHFENDEFLILEKPSGLACHGPEPDNLVQLLKEHALPCFLCHRLDKGSSGLLIIAKTSTVADAFRLLFENNKIEKYYLALSAKKGKKKQGTIKGNMAKSRDGKWILNKHDENNKQSKAITQFFSFALPKTIKFSLEKPIRIFIIKITGGKTHQIRVALKSNSSPVLGDSLYKGADYSRMCLHAYALRFSYQGEDYCFKSKIEFLDTELSDLDKSFKHYSSPWLLPWPKINTTALLPKES